MSLHLCMLFILNKHLYTFYIYMQYLSRGMLVVTLAAAPVVTPFTSFRASSERSEGSLSLGSEMLRGVDTERSECAQHDRRALSMTGLRSV